ncbi:hypothetical protein EVAR_92308_1 [Eumeta japonica]|uniref:Uncharacterized protein n=1 Tax=Eumeta variegata TaxID=151549 RepID=A0A4C2AC25_EUMVA|nr:hypothetical protein EVAR_92308_1 [Eumeta japonica]
MTGAVHAGTPRAGRRDSPRSERISSQHAAPTDAQNVIMYSDEFGSMHQVASLFSREIKYKIKERLDVVSLSVERTIEVGLHITEESQVIL